MAKHNSHLSFFYMIFFTAFLCVIKLVAGEGCFWSNGYFVNVANEIKKGDKVLVHCKSKDNDLGPQTIGYNESVHWQFCENIVSPGTVYFCHFYLGNTEQVFDVFNANMKNECVEKEKKPYWRCTWLIQTDGFYFVDRTSGVRKDIKKFDWKPMGAQ